VELTVLTVAGCPHATLLAERLAAALAGRPAPPVTWRVIRDPGEAARAGLHGSPTVLVDGTDPFAAPGQRASMSCRLYDNGPGQLEGAPSVGRLRQVILAQEREDRRARRTGSSGGAASGAPR
jgi:hypothetical protein